MTEEQEQRSRLGARKRWVVKIGSSLLTAGGAGIDRNAIATWTRQIESLVASGTEVVLVSSGAVAEGCVRLGFETRPVTVHELQAAAAVGQSGLIEAYEHAFDAFGRRTAMVLLTHDDLSHRRRYLNARTTLRTLLDLGVVPVINENDTVVTDEIRFGDNDTLAALVANLLEADVLVILTDTDGLHERDPRDHPAAALVRFGRAGDPQLEAMAGSGTGHLGRGGMSTKLAAAKLAARSGAMTVIAPGAEDGVLNRIHAGEEVGTLLVADVEPLVARKRWIAGQLRTTGELVLDDGAVAVLRSAGRSLLPVGVTATRGRYLRGDVVLCVDAEGRAVAKGLVNYADSEVEKILGASSLEIAERLGYVDEPELVHRDNLVLL